MTHIEIIPGSPRFTMVGSGISGLAPAEDGYPPCRIPELSPEVSAVILFDGSNPVNVPDR